MADTKISAMTPRAPTGAEFVPLAFGGQNYNCTTAQIAALGGGGGGPTWVTPLAGSLRWQNQTNTAFINFSDSGSETVILPNGFSASYGLAPNFATVTIGAGASENHIMNGTFVFQVSLAAGGFLKLDNNTNVLTINAFTSCFFQYNASAAGNWAVAMTDIWQALDRLAAAVVARTAGGPV